MSKLIRRSDNFFDLFDLFDRQMNSFAPLALFNNTHNYLNTHERSFALDVRENDNSFVLHADLPGIDRKNISVTVENRTLVVSAERENVVDDTSENVHRIERSFGKFYRSFTLPKNVDDKNVNATYDNGVLEVVLSKLNNNNTVLNIEVK